MQVGIEKIHYKLDKVNEYIQAIPTVGIAFFNAINKKLNNLRL